MKKRANTRYVVMAALFVLSLILYIDRAAISSAKMAIASELSLSDTTMGAVFSAFALGYAFAQIPSGWFADRVGPRIALVSIVTLWSVFTALTGASRGVISLLIVRFLFGAAEAGAFPSSARVFHNWLPPQERGIANGLLFSGALLGGGLAFPFFQWLFLVCGWRTAFYFLGVPGIIWAVCWFICFRDYPESGAANETEITSQRSLISQFRSPPMLRAMGQYLIGNFTFFICISWMNPYLLNRYSLSPMQAARFSMLPLVCGAVANWISGLLVDGLYRSRFRADSRRLPGMVGFFMAASGIYMAGVADTPVVAVAAFSLALFGIEMTISPSWAYCLDFGGRHPGSLSAAMNMAGSVGAFASANAFPWLQRWTGASDTYFRTAAGLNLVAVLVWYGMRFHDGENAASVAVVKNAC
jgi:MFS transporter, ACS family, glucarate transporter